MVFKTVASSAKTIVDLTDAYTVTLSNESVSIACDAAGTAIAGELGAAGKAISALSVYKGSLALTPVASGAIPAVGQYKYTIGTTTGSVAIRTNDSTFYIASISADSGTIPVTIYIEGMSTTVSKLMTWNKSKTGETGRSITTVDVEYYLSTSNTAQDNGNWSTTAPAWTSGKYMWSRTKTTYSTGSPSYSNPACITGTAGQTGGTGTGITSITEEYSKSTSKTTEPTSGWQTSMPVWTTGSYVWTRSKIIYSNPTSTVYTTAYCDSSWEAVNEVKVGGTNLWPNSAPEKSWNSWSTTDVTKSLDTSVTWNGKPTLKAIKGSTSTGGLNFVVRGGLPASTEFTYSFMVRSSVSISLAESSLGHMQVIGTSNAGNVHRETGMTYSPATIPANTWTKAVITFKTPAEASAGETFEFRSYLYYLTYGATFYFSDFQLEYGNKATDWSPAPEDVTAQIETKSRTFTTTPVVPYNSGDIWKNGTTTYVSTVTRLTGSYTVGDWVKIGDITSENTAADTTAVGGTAAATIVSGASAGTTANSTVTANKSTWDRANSFDASGNLATTKLTGTLSDTQIASATAWNNAKTLVNDITTDGTLTPFEKQTLKPEYDAILKEKIEAVTLATSYRALAESYYTNYINAYNALYGGMNTMMTTNIASNSAIDRNAMNGWFTNYYEKAAIFQRSINEAARTIASGAATSAATANELAKAMTSGKSLYKDNVFAAGLNGLTVYNNSANSNVTVTRIANPADTPTTSTHAVEIKNIGAASPGIGGFIQPLTARANAKFVIRYIAKIPVGYTIATASNSMGTGYTDTFLTATAGTGKYEEYIRVVQCGATGTFSNGGHVYLNGAVGSAGTPVVWYVARIDTYDVSDYEPFASHINADPNTVRISGSKLHFTGQVLMDNAWINNLVANSIITTKIQATELDAGKITAGTLNADRIAAGSLSGDKITANTIDATRLKIGSGAQGGYINNPRFSSWSGAYPDGTSLWSAGGISKVTVDNVFMAQFAPAAGAQQGMTLNSDFFANGIDLDGMQYFTLECRFRLTSGTNPAGACLLVDIYRQDATSERITLNMAEAGATLTTNTWYVARKVFKLADANIAKTFKNVNGFLLANYSASGDAAKTIQFASVNMFQASAQEFLAQSWTNGGTTSINGGFIATGTLSADKITTGALNASLITTGNFDAARITAGTINAGNGKSTINMSTGAFSFGDGKIAFDGTTLSLNVDSLKITNSSVATQTYASSAANTAKSDAISAAASDATSKVNSLQIGGRNTFKKTTTINTILGTNTSTKNSLNGMSIVSTNAGIARINNVISENGFWTFSAWVTSTVASTLAIDFCDMPTQNFAVSTTRTKIIMTSNVTNYTSATYHFIDIGGLIAATYTFEDVKIEKGNKPTDWTPAPEDVTYDIEQKADTVAVSDSINNISSSVSGAQATANAKLDKSAYDNFIKEYGEYKDALAADQSVAAGNLQAAQTAVTSIQKEMGNMKESWTFNNGTKIEATGNGMLISDGNPTGMNVLLSQNRLSFFDGGVEVAYIADKTMKINHGIFVKSAQIGSHLISTSPTNSDITIISFVGEG